ncbi:hypothetical protein EUX98_g7859 [Antrodiella citrinella]|uniref:DUF6535 domain-containing protein n=1 Tax=Antrodiella citrinella TaxID=2447956 RepID=A0A4S4MSJ9_9APHY|nr:hypothetical protein EUX98_g7859 [Antrodiella citrinella]
MFNPSAFLNYPRPLLRTASFSSDEDETSSSDSDSSDSTGEAHVLQSTPPKSDLGLDPDLISDAFPLNLSHSVAASQDGDSDWTQKTSTSDHIALEASATSDPGAQILDNAHADAVDGLILLRRPSYTTAIQDDDPMDCEDARHASDSEGRRAANLPAVTLKSFVKAPDHLDPSTHAHAIHIETPYSETGENMHPQTSGATDGESTNSDGAKSSRSRRRKRSQHSRDADRPHSSNRAAGDDASPPAADTTKTNIEGGTQGDERLDLPKAMAILQHILNVLERTDSKIVSPLSKLDSWPLLWSRYKTLADEYDKDLVERYREDMETSSIFAGLFSAVVATVAGMTLPTLSADPNLKTQVVLQAILHSLDPTAGNPAEVASSVAWNGPSISVLWVQSLLYASLTCSLFAALGSVMGRQWLGKYSSVGEHGTLEDRCKERQRKFDALQTWHFFTVLEAIPVLLQASLLLFGLGLSAYMWSQTVVVAAVLIAMNGVGALAYFWLIKSSAQYPDCPFYSPLSSRLRSAVNSVSIIWGERSLYWGPLRKAVSTVTSPPIAVFNAYMLGPLVSGSVFLSSWLRSFHCGAAADEESVVSRPAPPTITQRLLTVLEVLLQPLRSCFSRVRGQLRHVLTPPPTIVQKLWMIVEFIRQSVRTCSSRVMDVLRQLLASDEQASSDEAMTVVAFLWLWETSTDPITRDDMMQLVPEIPRGMMADRFSLHHLDFLLDRMVECIDHGDDINGDKFLSFGRAYLVLHVELLVFRDPHDEINVGVNQAEHVSKVHLIKYKTLPFLRYSTDSGEGPNLNRLLYFTLDNFYRGLRDFDASRLLREFSIHNYDARATPTSNIYTTTLLYLGHLCASGYVSLHEYRMELDWISHIVTHCLHISERDRDHDRLLLVVLAMLLGHNHLAVTSDAQRKMSVGNTQLFPEF